MSRIDFVDDDYKGGFKLTDHDSKNIKEITNLVDSEGWKAQIHFDFETNKWVCYCFKKPETNKKYDYKKYTFNPQTIANYMTSRGDLGETLFEDWATIQFASQSFIRRIGSRLSGKVFDVRSR